MTNLEKIWTSLWSVLSCWEVYGWALAMVLTQNLRTVGSPVEIRNVTA